MISALSIVALFIKILFAPSFVLDLPLFCCIFVIYIDTYCSTFTEKFEFWIIFSDTLRKAKEWLEIYFQLPLVITANNFISQ
jgi:hypothetical protein